ncbi:NADP-dependent oxidoreductase [Ferrimonas balearica]|uniref:NADP-dependent oxidoreductase n=1 Tax=Ferrimonas balearica TaxID=44012 RepID=UPI001C9932C3|nr:NADP-dependent oxidoreductase [Ferrimonas balearica]MBY5921689.1 NADP-dependent oxidoreductase [Ferrimonas balearica]MBY5994971.1 NADP-dependent oxidoreductase [Ferrimonas balearica]
MSVQATGWSLIHYPQGLPNADSVRLEQKTLPELETGQLLIRNQWLSVDPYMRGRMIPVKSYVPPFQLGEWMEGGAVGEVIASNHPDFQVGQTVLHMLGWRDLALSDGTGVTPVDPQLAPAQSYLGVLGLTGLTAWVGLNRIGEVKAGDTVFVSGAAGAVGTMVCQLAKLKGARVIGSVGSPEKAAYLTETLGVDGVVQYKTCGDLSAAVAALAPEGISLYFDNVGGDHLEAALANMQENGQLVICGMIDLYNSDGQRPGPRNLTEVIRRRLRIQGFIASDHMADYGAFVREVGPALASGQVRAEETVVEGLEEAFEAFLGLFSGANTGKMLVKL